MAIKIVKYQREHKGSWDEFIRRSKNGVFLFLRDYMEYHSDRFVDHSLLFYEAEDLVAVMPANMAQDEFISHGGLTFGGLVTNTRMKTALMLDLFDSLREYLISIGANRMVYKAIPHIYHQIPAEEDLYALFAHDARLFRRDVSSSILMSCRQRFSKGRRWLVKRARKLGLVVRQTDDFDTFMAIEEKLLREKYGIKPVHTPEELGLLAGRFPDNIKLFASYRDNEMLGGVVIYESPIVAHAQYISATDEGKDIGATDIIFDYLIMSYYKHVKYFDFGVSTEDEGRYLNKGLIRNKETYGARAVVHSHYEVDLILWNTEQIMKAMEKQRQF